MLGEQDVADGPAATVVLSYDYWTTAYARRSGRARQDARRRRPAADDRRRRAARVRRHDARRAARRVRAADARVVSRTPADAARRGPVLQLRLCVRPLEARRLASSRRKRRSTRRYRAMVNDVEVPSGAVARSGRRHRGRIARRACRSCPVRAARAESPELARAPLAVFFAATATILLIGCVNLANLMFARGAARIGEIAVRASLGAARRRLVSLLSVEALLLAGFAARREPARRARRAARDRRVAAAGLERRRRRSRPARRRGGLRDRGARDARVRAAADLEARRDRPGASAARQQRARIRRQESRPVPLRARDDADRAVDAAARARGVVHAEPREHRARRPGAAHGVDRHVQGRCRA